MALHPNGSVTRSIDAGDFLICTPRPIRAQGLPDCGPLTIASQVWFILEQAQKSTSQACADNRIR
jgi:hypothetical protein